MSRPLYTGESVFPELAAWRRCLGEHRALVQPPTGASAITFADEPVFINPQQTAVSVFHPSSRRPLEVHPLAWLGKHADGVYAVEGEDYRQFVHPGGPLMPFRPDAVDASLAERLRQWLETNSPRVKQARQRRANRVAELSDELDRVTAVLIAAGAERGLDLRPLEALRDSKWSGDPSEAITFTEELRRAIQPQPEQPLNAAIGMQPALTVTPDDTAARAPKGPPKMADSAAHATVTYARPSAPSVDEFRHEVGVGNPVTPVTPSHSADFTTVNWFGQRYTFDDGQQAKAVGVLWSEFEKGEHGLSEKTIGEAVGSASDNYRLIHTFRTKAKGERSGRQGQCMHPAWGKMIQKVGSGCYKLAEPESRQNPT